MGNHHKTSEELEREIEARRARIEGRVDDISARLSPGQLLDEALRYTKSGPGADFTRNLGRSVVDNPLPVAMIGASLGLLAFQSTRPPRDDAYDDDAYNRYYDRYEVDEEDHPVAIITGTSITRVGTSESEGNRFAEFADQTGRRFKALTDETGNRAGHFTDETGRRFRGFVDESGHRISDFRDEAGNRLHQATGWAAHNWRKAGEGASRFGHSMRDGAGQIGRQARDAGRGMRHQGENAMHAADDFVHEQPLVSGAIAFAIGAILGGVLPHTRQEDRMFGEASDSIKRGATNEAERLYEKGRDEAAHLHDEARDAAGKANKKAKEALHSGTEQAKTETDNVTHH